MTPHAFYPRLHKRPTHHPPLASHAQFYSIVALPQFSAFCKVFPGAMPLFLSVMENYNM